MLLAKRFESIENNACDIVFISASVSRKLEKTELQISQREMTFITLV